MDGIKASSIFPSHLDDAIDFGRGEYFEVVAFHALALLIRAPDVHGKFRISRRPLTPLHKKPLLGSASTATMHGDRFRLDLQPTGTANAVEQFFLVELLANIHPSPMLRICREISSGFRTSKASKCPSLALACECSMINEE
jgi:hypothetical protein